MTPNELAMKLVTLAGMELNTALDFARYQPTEAKELMEKIEQDKIKKVAENNQK